MSLALGYLRRDYLIWSSYRLAAFWQVAAVGAMIALIYFVGTAIGGRSELIDQEDGSYVAFVLVGIAFMDVLLQAMGSIPGAVQDQQRAGTLEPMLLAPISDLNLLVSFWLFPFVQSLFRMTIFIGAGVLLLGFWSSADPLSVIVIVVLAEVTFFAIGTLSAASVILVKQGDPVRLAYVAAITVLGGVLIPTEALPGWLQALAQAIPLTHALSGIREGLAGGSLADVAPQAVMLTLMAIVLLPLGLYAFHWAMHRARQEGSLGEY